MWFFLNMYYTKFLLNLKSSLTELITSYSDKNILTCILVF